MNPEERRTRVTRATRPPTATRPTIASQARTPGSTSTRPALRSVAASTLASTPVQRPITSTKRDSLQAELEKDPQLSSAKRQQRTQAFSSSIVQSSLERQVVSLQATKNELENKLRDKDAEIERLETERRFLSDREAEEKGARQSSTTQWEVEKRNLHNTLKTLRAAYETLQEEHTDLTDEHDRMRRRGASEQDALRLEVSRLSKHLGHLSQELEEYKTVSNDRARRIAELEAAASAAPTNAPPDLADRSSDDIITAELARQTTYISTLERRNERLASEVDALRARHASVEVLREENRSLQKKVKAVDELREALGQAEAERDHWQQQASAKSGDSTQAAELAAEVSKLRGAQAQLADDLGNKSAALRVKQTELMVMAGELDAAKRELDAAKSEIDELKDKERRLNDRVTLGEREIGFLKSMVSTYEREQDNAPGGDESMSVDGDSSTAISPAATLRIQSLEELLAEYKSTNEKLAAEVARAGENPSDLFQQTEHLRAELKASEEKHAETLEQLDQLEQTLFELGGEIAGGRYVPPNTRILTATDSPEANWFAARTEALEALKKENEALRQQISEGANTDANANTALPQASADAWQHEKAALTQELAQAHKRWQRLKQVFNAKAEEFTETVRNVLGVKVAFFGNGSVRVTSVYDLEAQFAFEPIKDGNAGEARKMRMVGKGRGGGEDVDEQMEYWIRKEGSIPCFLATMTLVSFEKWKQEQIEKGAL
ncbi:spindle assembly checkpoint component Mad1 [Schizophyllum commune]